MLEKNLILLKQEKYKEFKIFKIKAQVNKNQKK